MRRPKLTATHFTVLGVAAATVLVLPMTSASAAFDDGDYALDGCGHEATLQVRDGGAGLDVVVAGGALSRLFVHSERVDGQLTAALVIDLGSEDPDDNTVVTVSSADSEGLSCEIEFFVSDDEVAMAVGLEADAADGDSDEADLTDDVLEATGQDASEGNGPPAKVIVCHKPDGPNTHEFELSEVALASHLDHGDHIGPCATEASSDLSDDDEVDDAGPDHDARRAERDAAAAERDAAAAKRDAAAAERDAAAAERDAARAERKDSLEQEKAANREAREAEKASRTPDDDATADDDETADDEGDEGDEDTTD